MIIGVFILLVSACWLLIWGYYRARNPIFAACVFLLSGSLFAIGGTLLLTRPTFGLNLDPNIAREAMEAIKFAEEGE